MYACKHCIVVRIIKRWNGIWWLKKYKYIGFLISDYDAVGKVSYQG